MSRDWPGTVALITGANTGIGLSTAHALASLGATVILACRSPEKARAAADQLTATTGNDRIEVLQIDLADLASVRGAAELHLSTHRPLHLLINNGGIALQRGQTKDGFELAFGVNHLGHFLFTDLLMDRLSESAPARIVNVSSGVHFRPSGIDFERLRESTPTYVGLREYNVSKLCNVLFTEELARRHDPAIVSSFSSNPGPVDSDIWRRMPEPVYRVYQALRRMKSTEDGARPTLRAATEPGIEPLSGAYFDEDTTIVPTSPIATPDLARELWDRSAAWVAKS